MTNAWRRLADAHVPAAVLAVLSEPATSANASGDVIVGGAGGVAIGAPDGSWTAADPGIGAVAGVVRAGSVLLAGGASGIARSSDGGRTWRRAVVHGVAAPVTSLVAAGGNTLAGTLGSGVLRSADDGRTWAPAGFGLASHDVSALAFVDDHMVLAGTDDGIHASPNAGRAWRQVAGTSGLGVTALAVHGDVAWAAAETGEVLVSSDGGRAWTRRGPLPARAVPSALETNGDVVVVATDAGILRSADGGETWDSAHREPVFTLAIAAGGELIAGTGSGLVSSGDDGRTWSPRGGAPPVHDVSRLVVTGAEVLAYGPMAGVVRCVAGVPMVAAPRPVSVVTAGPHGVVLAAGPGGLARSTDAGRSWVNVLPGDAGFVHVLAPAEDGSWWAASADGARLLRSADGGRTWVNLSSPWGTATVLALAARADTVLAATYDAPGAAVDLWRGRVDGPWSHSGRVPTPRPSVQLSLDPPAAAFDGRWVYGSERGWRPGDGPAGRLRRLIGAGGRLFALTETVLAESADSGRTWNPIAGFDAAQVADVAASGAATVLLTSSGELWTTAG
ncbi:hypothetical protein E1262_01855 [Jiangella aurantiaca]|uniref:Photosynthesis system II assembly factor Ycf48/Hcf136-like domain-containing protein n=1 Tax=Jiangella aurantiaca TaxID=2530373 RepID=A0A4R5AIN8_9ACTN|nr:hypothetical protein [Jiangella aurantiaca]TDD72628.1 hypothetical protein E1262_01855 [Jiangella aurantiaca]